MNTVYTYLALDIAHERTREARESRLAASVVAGRPSIIRRGLAQGLAAVSRGSAAAARRLDAVTPSTRSTDHV